VAEVCATFSAIRNVYGSGGRKPKPATAVPAVNAFNGHAAEAVTDDDNTVAMEVSVAAEPQDANDQQYAAIAPPAGQPQASVEE
jgi:hypothetical protein